MYIGKIKTAVTILWCLLMLAPNSSWAGNLRLLVVLSDSLPAYQSFANTLKLSLPESVQATVQEYPGEIKDQHQIDMIVSVGLKASISATFQTKVPVLVVMVPRESYQTLFAQTTRINPAPSISAIYLDQPWERQLNFIQAILPEHRRIGLLYSPQAHIDLTSLRKHVSKRDIKLIANPVSSEDKLFSTLKSMLLSSDILLAVPDNTIYNSNNIRNVLLSCYRSGIPFVGLSQAYVDAGAIGAIFSSQQQLANQIAEAIHYFERYGKLPRDSYSRDFSISLNHEVARSMGINLPTGDMVRYKIHDANRSAQ